MTRLIAILTIAGGCTSSPRLQPGLIRPSAPDLEWEEPASDDEWHQKLRRWRLAEEGTLA